MAFEDFRRRLSDGIHLLAAVAGILAAVAGIVMCYIMVHDFLETKEPKAGVPKLLKATTAEQTSVEAEPEFGPSASESLPDQAAEPTVQTPSLHEVKPSSPVHLQSLQTTVTMAFHSVGGEEFATFTVTPPRSEPIVQPYLGAERDMGFTALGKAYRLRILEVDIDEQVARFDVCPEN